MKAYIAGSITLLEVLRNVRDRLEQLDGVEITSSWLDETMPISFADPNITSWQKRAVAYEDIEDVNRAQVMFLFPEEPSTSGGFHTEAGMMLQRHRDGEDVRLIIVGGGVNIFHEPKWIEHRENLTDLVGMLIDEGHRPRSQPFGDIFASFNGMAVPAPYSPGPLA